MKNHPDIYQGIVISGIDRDEIYISTKIHDKTQKSATIREEVMTILKELNTTYLNQVLLHSPVKNRFIESWKELEKLQKEGLIINIGVSNFRVSNLEHLLQNCQVRPFVNQFEVHPFCTREKLVTFCQKENIQVQAYSSLVVGRKFDDPKLMELSDRTEMAMYELLLLWQLQSVYRKPH